MEIFQKRLKEALKQANLSQCETARRLGVKQQSVWFWLNKGYPDVPHLIQLCDMLNTTPNYLLGMVD